MAHTVFTAVRLHALAFSILVSGCQPAGEQSLNEAGGSGINSDLAGSLAKSSERLEQDCPRRALFVLIGSSEAPGLVSEWHRTQPSAASVAARDAAKAAAFATEIEQAGTAMYQRLAQRPRCLPSALNPEGKTEMVLLRIIDGDGDADSRIDTTIFADADGAWRVEATRTWRQQHQDLVATAQPAELNLPATVSGILWTVATQTSAALRHSASLRRQDDIAFEQILYFVKAHGGLLAEPAAALVLYDRHGQSEVLRSSLFVPYRETGAGQTSADGDTAGVDVMPTAGKGMAYSRRFTAPGEDAAGGPADGVVDLGHVATYRHLRADGLADGGVHTLDLPAGLRRPTLVVLDSCYGSPVAAEAVHGDGALTILYNPGPLYYEFLDYGAMDAAEYLALPAFLVRLGTTGPSTQAEQRMLDRLRRGDDVSGSSPDLPKARYKELHLWSRAGKTR